MDLHWRLPVEGETNRVSSHKTKENSLRYLGFLGGFWKFYFKNCRFSKTTEISSKIDFFRQNAQELLFKKLHQIAESFKIFFCKTPSKLNKIRSRFFPVISWINWKNCFEISKNRIKNKWHSNKKIFSSPISPQIIWSLYSSNNF